MRRKVKTIGGMFLIGVLIFSFSPTMKGAQNMKRPSPRSVSNVSTFTPSSPADAFSLLGSVDAMHGDNGVPALIHKESSHAVVDEAELYINVKTSPEAVVPGSSLTFTIKVMNKGAGFASPFTVEDELPPETTFVSCETIGGGLCGGADNKQSIAFNTLAPNATVTITLTATVNCSVANVKEIANTAAIHLSTHDPEADENETVFITVSNPPPSITGVTANPSQLSPLGHQMVNVSIGYRVSDNCGQIFTELKVASNEAVNDNGNGDHASDWEIVNEHLVRLRAEQASYGTGRLYTITITATDSAGQSSSRTVTVSVPKSYKE